MRFTISFPLAWVAMLGLSCGSAQHAPRQEKEPRGADAAAAARSAETAQPGAPRTDATASSLAGPVKSSTTKSPAEIAAAATPAIVSVRTPEALGTGFIVREDGWVVTNFHVVEASPRIVVTLGSGKIFPVVEVVSANREHDLVILRIDAKDLPILTLADGDSVRAGDWVVAIGHPLGLEDTVSNGLVSAVRHAGDLTVLQISAPIAPGSSGGPLFNDHGEVIGVATAILQGGQNLNLGLPVQYVKDLLAHPAPIPVPLFAAGAGPHQRKLPRVERHVPDHPVELLQGCSRDVLIMLTRGMGEAIDAGAPLYNQGNFGACYHVYEGTAVDLERRLPSSCQGPKRALEAGRKKAEKLDDPSAQAWPMRDAFDGLLQVIVRKAGGRHH